MHRRRPGFRHIGPDVSGSIYCPLDGHVNSLRLFRALHAALKARGVDYRADHAVTAIEPRAGGFALTGAWGEMRAAKVVLAARDSAMRGWRRWWGSRLQ